MKLNLRKQYSLENYVKCNHCRYWKSVGWDFFDESYRLQEDQAAIDELGTCSLHDTEPPWYWACENFSNERAFERASNFQNGTQMVPLNKKGLKADSLSP